jgi:hypothetical protein
VLVELAALVVVVVQRLVPPVLLDLFWLNGKE